MGNSDWKQSAIDRKDFRRSKTGPEVPKKVGTRKKKKPFKVVIKDHVWSWNNNRKPSDWNVGNYKKYSDAEKAVKHYKTVKWYKDFEIVIEENK